MMTHHWSPLILQGKSGCEVPGMYFYSLCPSSLSSPSLRGNCGGSGRRYTQIGSSCFKGPSGWGIGGVKDEGSLLGGGSASHRPTLRGVSVSAVSGEGHPWMMTHLC